MTIGLITSNGTIVQSGRKLDIGAGEERLDGFETMDVSPYYTPDFQHDMLNMPWPFGNETFTELRCYHVLEHLPPFHWDIDWDRREVTHVNTQVAVLNEMWRILQPGGVAQIETPVFPYWPAIADPTHVSMFLPQTWSYFVTLDSYRKCMRGAQVPDHTGHRNLYGIREWEMRRAYRNEQGSILAVELVKPRD